MSWPETVRRKDFDITWFSGTGGGGQYRNKHANCCRMVHKPTGTRTTGQSNRDRPSNEKEAFKSMIKILVPLMEAAASRDVDSESSERIRTYNYVRKNVTDDRVPGKVFELKRILNGDIDQIINDVLVSKGKV